MLALLALSSCSTPYQPDGYLGGYSDTQLSDNTFLVTFNGNGYTDPHKATEFRLLRAADVTLGHGFRYFTIDESGDTSTRTFMGSHGGGSIGGGELFFPRGTIRIICAAQKPNDGKNYLDAQLISKNVRSQYGL